MKFKGRTLGAFGKFFKDDKVYRKRDCSHNARYEALRPRTRILSGVAAASHSCPVLLPLSLRWTISQYIQRRVKF